ncbi:transglycosylase domain-containing protein [Paenibacillus sp. 1P07SE]|uniref:transglycosylase domain-containing protein n=1 Tax=Paenibacillus sp. 1P07SE TaxID=3132209 RepID=UPI0039A755AD
MNHVYMGRGQYGVRAAAKRYYGIDDLGRLELWQMASLAAIPKGPSVYNPVDGYERNKTRRQLVLSRMHQQDIITDEQMRAAAAQDGDSPAATGAASGRYAAYIDYVLWEAEIWRQRWAGCGRACRR